MVSLRLRRWTNSQFQKEEMEMSSLKRINVSSSQQSIQRGFRTGTAKKNNTSVNEQTKNMYTQEPQTRPGASWLFSGKDEVLGCYWNAVGRKTSVPLSTDGSCAVCSQTRQQSSAIKQNLHVINSRWGTRESSWRHTVWFWPVWKLICCGLIPMNSKEKYINKYIIWENNSHGRDEQLSKSISELH